MWDPGKRKKGRERRCKYGKKDRMQEDLLEQMKVGNEREQWEGWGDEKEGRLMLRKKGRR
jgi:hypothetical protein